MVARGGFEPPRTVPKTAVLPLDDQAIFCETGILYTAVSNLFLKIRKSGKASQARKMDLR